MKQVVEFILFPRFSETSISGALEIFNTANQILKEESRRSRGYRFRFTGLNKGIINSESGLAIRAEADVHDNPPSDILLIPGGPGVRNVLRNRELMDYVRKKSKETYRIMSISRGILIPAAAGILNGKKAAAHWQVQNQLRNDYPEVIMDLESLYTQDDNIWTSAGISCAMDMTLAILEEDFNFSLALEVSRQLVLYYKRRDNQALYISPHRSRASIKDHFDDWNIWLKDNIHENLTVDRMAEAAEMSSRNFARVFVRDMGISPSKYLEELRLNCVRNRLMEGEDSLQTIARECGLGNEERLRRAFIRLYGLSPAQFRNFFIPEQETV